MEAKYSINGMKPYEMHYSQKFDNNKIFLDQLRVCIDKRKMLYKALNLKYTTFGITDYGENDTHIKKSDILNAAKKYRELATVLWGKESLCKQNASQKAIIGKSFNGLNKKSLSNLPDYLNILLGFNKIGSSLESALTDELAILRTLSELFSTFEEEVFIYYFAQYFAQSKYNNYLKMAPYSEVKFDSPFEKKSSHFNTFINTNEDVRKRK